MSPVLLETFGQETRAQRPLQVLALRLPTRQFIRAIPGTAYMTIPKASEFRMLSPEFASVEHVRAWKNK